MSDLSRIVSKYSNTMNRVNFLAGLVLVLHISVITAPRKTSASRLLQANNDRNTEENLADINDPDTQRQRLGARMKQSASKHFDEMGVKLPEAEFVKAVSDAAITMPSPDGSTRKLVIMAMANELALSLTVPLFLSTMHDIPCTHASSTKGGPEPLSHHVVIATPSEGSYGMCMELAKKYGQWCVRDHSAELSKSSMPFHSSGFNLIGFAKTK